MAKDTVADFLGLLDLFFGLFLTGGVLGVFFFSGSAFSTARVSFRSLVFKLFSLVDATFRRTLAGTTFPGDVLGGTFLGYMLYSIIDLSWAAIRASIAPATRLRPWVQQSSEWLTSACPDNSLLAVLVRRLPESP